jgi:hypothetical protein
MFTESEQFFTSGGSYQIDQSCRFNDNDSAYMTRTPGSASSHTTFTTSMWIKRSRVGSMRLLSTALGTSNREDEIYFESNDRLQWQSYNGGVSYGFRLLTSAVYRDFSAWMHIVAVLDSTNGTAADRQRLYVNGERITNFATEVQASSGYVSSFNNTQAHYFGRYYSSAVDLYDGYMAEINFVDGTALDPSSFGETNDDGVWVPIEYTGAYGTNGFYLDFSNSSDFGSDQSGNGNDFTDSGLATNDQVTDSPTNNFCTWNYLDTGPTALTFSNGNLQISTSSGSRHAAKGTIGVSSGKWYWEMTKGAVQSGSVGVGSQETAFVTDGYVGNSATSWGYLTDGNKANNSTTAAYGATFTTSDVIGVALDMDAGSITFYKNNTSQGVAYTGLSGTVFPMEYTASSAENLTDFGQLGYTYTPPTGFLALNTSNLPEPTIKDGSAYFNPLLWTGDAASPRSFTGLDFTPDFIWGKNRSAANANNVWDIVRGVSKALRTDNPSSEASFGTDGADVTSFDSGGFTATVGTVNFTWLNTSAQNYVAWCWKAGGAGSSNTDGSITSTVSANPTAGFSILTYTGTGANATVGHGLGVAPKMVIVRERSPGGDDWYVYHAGGTGVVYSLRLNTTQQLTGPDSVYWNSTAPTSSVFSLGTSPGLNENTATYVAYCFAEVEGYSKFGKYTGNGSTNGPMVNCGFRPAFVMFKRSDSTGSWFIEDSARGTYNVMGPELYANSADAEATASRLDFLSNGFKLRAGNAGDNASGGTYIYMAFAENPFGGADTAPATAR